MISQVSQPILITWCKQAAEIIFDCFETGIKFLDNGQTYFDEEVRFVSAQLFQACHLTSESTLILIRECREWDADLLSRSVLEGSYKLTFMLHGTDLEVRQKVQEYWHLLPRFCALRHDSNVRLILEAVPDRNAEMWEPLRQMTLSATEIEEIRNKHSRTQRKTMEEKWSFSGVCREFAKSGDNRLQNLGRLAHQYCMSSHILHMDGDGVGIINDRLSREFERKFAATISHSARLIGDSVIFSILRLSSVLLAAKQDMTLIKELNKRLDKLLTELGDAHKLFYDVEYGEKSQQA